MIFLELLCYSILVFVIATAVALPLGHLCLLRFFSAIDRRYQILTGLGLGYLLFAAAVCVGLLIDLPNTVFGGLLALLTATALAQWIYSGKWRVLLQADIKIGFALVAIYGLLVMTSVAFPAGNLDDIAPDTIVYLTDLPVDNILPYQFSRYAVEGYDPATLPIIPDWSASDRGPLAGLLAAGIFLLLGLEEKAIWGASSPGLYFVFQALLVFLNLLSLLATWFVGIRFFGRRATLLALLLLVSSFFFFENIVFTWPKFFASFYLLTAFALWRDKASWLLIGALLAGGLLSHNLANLYFVAFVGYLCFEMLLRHRSEILPAIRNAVRGRLAAPLAGLLLCLSCVLPWSLYKTFAAPSSGRMLHMHLFCDDSGDVGTASLIDGLEKYLATHSFGEILLIRLENLVYPFDFGPTLSFLTQTWPDLFTGLSLTKNTSFFQIIHGVGFLAFCLFAIAMSRWRNEQVGDFLPLTVVAYGALVVSACIFGCSPWTSSHVWGYLAFLVTFLPAGWIVANSGLWATIIFISALSINLFYSIFAFYYDHTVRVAFHATPNYGLVQGSLLLFFFGLCVFAYRNDEQTT